LDRKQILIVEDERIAAEDIKNSLQNLGYDVTGVVSSGEEAIKKAVEKKPDLVLMDIKLKGELDGIDTADKIRSLLNVPIVYLTAHADVKTLERAKITEPFGYIIKPFENRELQINIEMALYKWIMENRLKEAEKWFSTALWSIREAVIATDKKGAISFMNPAAERLTQWNLEDVVGKPMKAVFSIINQETGKPIEDLLTELTNENYNFTSIDNTVLITKDGKMHPIEKSCSSIKDDKGNIAGNVLVFRDITQRKHIEQEYKEYIENLEKENQQQRAELIHSEKMVSLGYLVTGIAHEINNPIAYVRSNTEFIRDGLSETKEHSNKKETQIENIAQIKKLLNINLKGIDRITTIIKGLQIFAKPETGGKVPVNINRGIEDVLLILETELKDQVKINKNYGPLPEIVCNIDQLKQVFTTLILNVSQTMDKGEIWIKTWSGSDFIYAEIKDSMSGKSEENTKKVHDSIFTFKGRNTGLSMSLCYRIIKDHNGEIEVENKIGKGTKITIKLPI
jgi:two-component system cell cycle sensor histidine kinase/response regulator CckA